VNYSDTLYIVYYNIHYVEHHLRDIILNLLNILANIRKIILDHLFLQHININKYQLETEYRLWGAPRK